MKSHEAQINETEKLTQKGIKLPAFSEVFV